MTENTASTTPADVTGGASRVDRATPQPTKATGSSTGKTVIDDGVIAKVAGLAARDVSGVHALGGNAARAFGAIRDVIGSTDHGQGVRVEVGETQVAVDVTVSVEYPVAMQSVADEVRSAVGRAITELVGMEVAEINVAINDVHIPGEDRGSESDESRVQ